jgi:FAD/FMN-containing dehydrogenase
MKKQKNNTKTLLWSVAAAAFLFVGVKTYDYAAAPIRPKDCDFITPDTGDQQDPNTLTIAPPAHLFNFEQIGGIINDASCLNKTAVYGVVAVKTESDIRNAVQFAKANDLKITPAGQRHSMGGQSFVKGGLVLDMRGFTELKLDKEHKILTAQTGATWEQIQYFLDKEGLSVSAMQSINIFTVGGTLSVNAHGIAHNPGQIAPTVMSLRIMLPNG